MYITFYRIVGFLLIYGGFFDVLCAQEVILREFNHETDYQKVLNIALQDPQQAVLGAANEETDKKKNYEFSLSRHLKQALSSDNTYSIVLLDQKQGIIGFALCFAGHVQSSGDKERREEIFFDALAIDKNERNKGHGSFLIGYMLHKARESWMINTIRTAVPEKHAAAIKAFKNNGFVDAEKNIAMNTVAPVKQLTSWLAVDQKRVLINRKY